MFKNIANYYNTIKALFKLKGEVKKMKMSELSTSEGRLAILGSIISIYGALHGFIPPALALQISGVLATAYIVVRGLFKFGETIAPVTKTTKDDLIVAEAQKLLDAMAQKIVVK